ncbi:hypothetical protein [Leeuwenhoekiella sp. NPDC079379]|uniref:hypothetical protein n=1 Tax=Leeuwenhoekiella sp. NPDC079379 TaxID=3364122 RepID=UPI0037CB3E69
MYEELKNIAEQNNWVFEYSRRDFQNLYNETENDSIYLFVDPIRIDTNFDEYGGEESLQYSGSFMVVKSSDVDEDYDTHYQSYIKPVIESATKTISNTLRCSDFNIQSWSTVEVINALDYNFSGVIVSYTITNNE